MLILVRIHGASLTDWTVRIQTRATLEYLNSSFLFPVWRRLWPFCSQLSPIFLRAVSVSSPSPSLVLYRPISFFISFLYGAHCSLAKLLISFIYDSLLLLDYLWPKLFRKSVTSQSVNWIPDKCRPSPAAISCNVNFFKENSLATWLLQWGNKQRKEKQKYKIITNKKFAQTVQFQNFLIHIMTVSYNLTIPYYHDMHISDYLLHTMTRNKL